MANQPINQKKLNSEISHAVMDDGERIEYLFASNWKKITAAAIAVVIIATAVIWAVAGRGRRIAAGANALADAKTAEELAAALKNNPGHENAGYTRFRLGKQYLEDGRYTEAAAEFAAVRGRAGGILLELASLNEGYALELAGEKDKAAGIFDSCGQNSVFSAASRAEADYAAVRLYLDLGEKERAGAAGKRAAAETSPAAAEWAGLAAQLLAAAE